MFTRKLAALLCVLTSGLLPASSRANDDAQERDGDRGRGVQVGPRPFYLVDKMSPSPLKRKLEQCSEGPFYKTDFSIGHRGGAPCNSRSTPGKAMKRARAWARASRNVM